MDSGTPAEHDKAKLNTVFHEQTKLKPETLVACANFHENAANEPKATPADREQRRGLALKNYRRALELDPNYAPAHLGLARLMETMGNHEIAVAGYRQVVRITPNDAAVWAELGMLQVRSKEYEPGIEALAKASQLDPANKVYAKSYGFSLARAGRYDESLVVLRKEMGEGLAQCTIARMLHHMGQEAASRSHAQLALEADPNLKPAQDLLAELDGRPGEAVSAPGPEQESPATE
jgi:tetratricopeptide (TPR) repeat protein